MSSRTETLEFLLFHVRGGLRPSTVDVRDRTSRRFPGMARGRTFAHLDAGSLAGRASVGGDRRDEANHGRPSKPYFRAVETAAPRVSGGVRRRDLQMLVRSYSTVSGLRYSPASTPWATHQELFESANKMGPGSHPGRGPRHAASKAAVHDPLRRGDRVLEERYTPGGATGAREVHPAVTEAPIRGPQAHPGCPPGHGGGRRLVRAGGRGAEAGREDTASNSSPTYVRRSGRTTVSHR